MESYRWNKVKLKLPEVKSLYGYLTIQRELQSNTRSEENHKKVIIAMLEHSKFFEITPTQTRSIINQHNKN